MPFYWDEEYGTPDPALGIRDRDWEPVPTSASLLAALAALDAQDAETTAAGETARRAGHPVAAWLDGWTAADREAPVL